MYQKWTKEELGILMKNYGKIPAVQIADKLPDRTTTSILRKAQRLGLRSSLGGNQYTTPRFDARIKSGLPDTADLGRLFDAIYEFQNASKKLSTRVDEATVEIDTGRPIAVGFLADAHIGAITCRYKELVERFELMVDTPGFYLFSVGDTIDNYQPQPHSSGMFGQLIPPELQKELVENLYTKMKGRWLGAVQGCHEEWSHEADDFDWTKYLSDKLGCPNLGFGGFVDLKVGKQEYKIHLRHKYRFGSSVNLTHTVKRMREQLGDFDVGCVAHHHQAAIEQVYQGDGVDRIFIRPGSFKNGDRYSRMLGFKDTGAQIPTVVFYPDRRLMIPFLHLEQAAEFMKNVYGVD